MKPAFHHTILALAAVGLVAGMGIAKAQQMQDQNRALKHYESGTKEFWTHPPDDWFLGDETEQQKGLVPPSGPPTGASDAELAALVKKIKLPPGFKIEVWAPGVLAARQMAWGDKGTLFVGSFGLGNAHARNEADGRERKNGVMESRFHRCSLMRPDGRVVYFGRLERRTLASAKRSDGKTLAHLRRERSGQRIA